MWSLWLLLVFGIAAAHGEEIVHKDPNSSAKWIADPNHANANNPRLLGRMEEPEEFKAQMKVKVTADVKDEDVPDEFDARDEWFDCEDIGFVWDQGNCMSSWAVSAAAVFSDRLCIHTGKTKRLSVLDMLACCDDCGNGCKGGNMWGAWMYYYYWGLVSGGEGPDCKSCQCYPFPTCRGSPKDPVKEGTPKCVESCRKGFWYSYREDKLYGKKPYVLPKDELAIRKEIMTNGPVQAALTIYADFMDYKSGIYFHVKGENKGGHAVRILGWGEEDGTPYWLIANSWCTNWGEEGLFRIKRGTNECGIEEEVIAGLPKK